MTSDLRHVVDQCHECGSDVHEGEKYCSNCGAALTELARYESRPEVDKMVDAMGTLIVALIVTAARLSVPAAALAVLVGAWPLESIGIALIAAILSFGLEKLEVWQTKKTVPDEVLREWGWIE